MKRLIAGVAALILAAGILCAQEAADTSRFGALGAKLDEYFIALEGESVDVQVEEVNFIISSCKDDDVRQWVALYVYDHYLNSKIMGEEAVALKVAQEWFLSGKVPMKSDIDLMNARVFVEFNKSSQIGMDAPRLAMKDFNGQSVNLPAKDAYSVLYFYDTGCSSCRLESGRLRTFLSQNAFPLEFYAVYTGSDEVSWARYRIQDLAVEGAHHLWDPEMDSDYQMKYGVLDTPQMFLIGPDGKIIGRKLDTPALGVLLSREGGSEEYVYGNKFQMDFFNALFLAYGDELSPDHVEEVASYIAENTLGEGDLEQYKQVEGDLLYYLYTTRSEALKAGTLPFIDKYILGADDIWTEPSDTANVLNLANMMKDLLQRTPIGKTVPDYSVPGVLRRRPCLFRKGTKEGVFRLRKVGNAYVVFYSEGCSSCKETLDAVEKLIATNRKAKVLLVNMDRIMEEEPELGEALLNSFDLSVMPLVLKLSKGGVVTEKYIEL